MRRVAPILATILPCVWAAGVQAHKPSDSYLTVNQTAERTTLSGQWDIALRDLEHAVGVDVNGDGTITWGELKVRRAQVTRYTFSHLIVEAIARGERNQCPLQPRDLLFDE